MKQVAHVMISSTVNDLPDHRKLLVAACVRLGVLPVVMESVTAQDSSGVQVSLDLVDKADLFVGVYGYRYGWIPPDANPNGKSITEMEFDRALERKSTGELADILIFLMGDSHPIRPGDVEGDEAQEKLKKFKERVSDGRMRETFDSASELEGKAILSIGNALRRMVNTQTYFVTNLLLRISLVESQTNASDAATLNFELSGICSRANGDKEVKMKTFGLQDPNRWQQECEGQEVFDRWTLGEVKIDNPGKDETRKEVRIKDDDLFVYAYAYNFPKRPPASQLFDNHRFSFDADSVRIEFILPHMWNAEVRRKGEVLRSQTIPEPSGRKIVFYGHGPWRKGDEFEWELSHDEPTD